MWSYGIMLIEMFSGVHPFQHIEWATQLTKLLRTDVEIDMPDPSKCSPGLIELMKHCTKVAPESRPTFKEIVATLEKMEKQFISLI